MPEALPAVGMIEPELLVATCTRDGSPVFRNNAWNVVFGETEDLWAHLVTDDRVLAEQNLREALRGSLVTHAVFLVARPDRDLPLPVLLHFVPVAVPQDDGGQTLRMVTITGERLTEPMSWTENQTDKHRMETLGRMTMGIAHDFNNLLSGILGHITLMKAESGISGEHVDTIEKAANDGAALINKIQRYIRQEKKETFESLDLTSLIHDCITLTRPYWYNEPRREGRQIDLEFSPSDLPSITGSPSELRDVFVNLILNAVQAMPGGGIIRISAESVVDSVEVRVEDTGTGMSESVRTRIFEPLFTTKGTSGTGMGLSVAFGVVQEHEGTIEVSSEPGDGTCFTLAFPITRSSPDSESIVESDQSARKARILVVDDEEMVLSVVGRLLKLKGHDVVTVLSGREALDALDSEQFDVIISDQGMPEMSGRELAHAIRRTYEDLPFILLTGDTELEVNPIEISRVATKPFQIDDLDASIRELL